MQCASRLSKGHICNIPRSAKCVNLKLSGYVEGNMEINCKTLWNLGCQTTTSAMSQELLWVIHYFDKLKILLV